MAGLLAATAFSSSVSQAAGGYTAQLMRYPYLTDVVNGYATINWATDQSNTSGGVRWGKVGSESCTAHYTPATDRNVVKVNGISEYQWKALLNLTPGTQYCYRVYLGSSPATEVDLLGTDTSPVFWTQVPAGSNQSYSFVVFGDWGSTEATPYQANLMSLIASSGARFALTVGDNGYPNGNQTNYGDLVQVGTDISAVFGPSSWTVPGSFTPIFAASGNHGVSNSDPTHPLILNFPQDRAVATSNGRYVKETYCCLDNTTSSNYPSAWYAFDSGLARIYILDATWADLNIGTASSPYQVDYDYHWTPTSPEYQWLQADLASHPSALKFAIWHYPAYADDPHEPSDTYLQGGSSLEALLKQYGVNLAFDGHSHTYQRFLASPTGLRNYVTGGGGAPLPLGAVGPCTSLDAYAIGYTSKGYACGSAKPPSTPDLVYHFLKVTVNGTSVTVTPINSTGKSFDVQSYTFSTTDTTAPSVPANLNATPATNGTEIDLNWSASTDNTAVRGYDVYRNGTLISTTDASTLNFADTGLVPGTGYIYTVDAFDAAGNHSAKSVGASATTPTTATYTFIPVADTYVASDATTTNYGTSGIFKADASPDYHSYLRFNVNEISGTVTKATLMLYTTYSSATGFDVSSVSGGWDEGTLTYANAPALGSIIGSSGKFSSGNWVSVDVTPLITGNGIFDLGISTTSISNMSFNSRDAADSFPQLVIQTTSSLAPTATPSATLTATALPFVPMTFTASADATINKSLPTSNFGSGTTLDVDNRGGKSSYVKFTITGTNGQPIGSAKLRFYNVEASNVTAEVHRVADNTWQESTITYNNAPVADATILANLGATTINTWYEVDVTSLVKGDGTYSFKLLQSGGNNPASYSSKEGGNAPQLVLNVQATPMPSPTPTNTFTPTVTATPSNTPTFTPTVTSTPTANPLPVFNDGFESRNLSAWTSNGGLAFEATVVNSGSLAVEGNTTNGATYAKKTFASTYGEGYARIYFNLPSYTSQVNLLRLRTSAGASIGYLFVSPVGKLGFFDDTTAVTSSSATASVAAGSGWHALVLHAIINGASSTTEVWLDGVKVNDLSLTTDLGTTPIGGIQIGDTQTARTYDVIFDDVIFDTQWIGLANPVPTPTVTDTPTMTFTPLPTDTPTMTLTATDTPLPSDTPTATATFTPTITPTATALPFVPMTFTASADAAVNKSLPTSNFGSGTTLDVDSKGGKSSYVKFTVAGTNGQPISSAKLRFYNVEASNITTEVHRVADNTWQESTLTYNNAPVADTTILASLGATTINTWYEVDVTSLVKGDGTYSFKLLQSGGNNAASYSSREGSNVPQLVLSIQATPIPSATPTNTFTPTATFTPTLTLTPSSTPTLTLTPTDTLTFTPSPTLTPSDTPTATFTPTNTVTFTPTVTYTPTANPAPVFNDGFESGSLAAWGTKSGLTVQSSLTNSGSFAAQGATSTTSAYAKRMLPSTYNEGYARVYFNLTSTSSQFSLLRFRSAADASLVYVFTTSAGKLGLRNDVGLVTANSTTSITSGWHALVLHVLINGTSSITEVWLDGVQVSALSMTTNLGTTPIGEVQIGDTATGTYNVTYDDVVFDTQWIGLSGTVVSTATPIASATATFAPTNTVTDTPLASATLTATPGFTATWTFTPVPTDTSIVMDMPTFTPVPTDTPQFSPTPTDPGAPINTATDTPIPSDTPAVATATPTYTLTPTFAPVFTATPSITPTSGAYTPVFSDGFESGSLSWTTSAGLTIESTTVHSGSFAVEGNTTVGNTFAKKNLPATYSDGYARIYFNIVSLSSQVNLLRFRDSSDNSIGFLFVNTSGKLGFTNAASVITTSTTSVGSGWHSLEFHAVIGTSTTEVWLDGAKITSLSITTSLGTNPIAKVQIGDVQSARTYDVIFDDVVFDTQRIGP